METSKFRTNVGRDGTIKLPPHLLEEIDHHVEYEIVVRPLRNRKKDAKTVDEVIRDIEEAMNAKYPRLKTGIIPELKKVIGISRDINKQYSQYSDRELIGMARMEKYLEKACVRGRCCKAALFDNIPYTFKRSWRQGGEQRTEVGDPQITRELKGADLENRI